MKDRINMFIRLAIALNEDMKKEYLKVTNEQQMRELVIKYKPFISSLMI